MQSPYGTPYQQPVEPDKVLEAEYRVADAPQEQPFTPWPQRREPSLFKRLIGPAVAALLFLATKGKFLLAALKGFKFLGTGITALLSVGAYALFWPWQFALGLVLMIFVHEMGHALILKRYGVAATAPIFIPFMGALIGMKQLPRNAVMEAYVGLGGPVIGSLAAFAAYAVYLVNGSPLFLALAFVGILLNLFNLLPVLPLDGGRAVGAISRWIWVIGYVGLIGLLFFRPSPILLLILIFGFGEVMNAIRGRGRADYYTVPRDERLKIAFIYFGLMALLGFMFHELSPLMEANRPR